jgi:predicted acylesterase/phospholipase RssA
MKRCAVRLAIALLVLFVAGCAHYPVNARLGDAGPAAPYRFAAMVLDRPDPADELFVCLSFSGGGTRAAALAYGALLALRDIDIGRGGAPKALLEEVDCIAGISGGAFTAAYYGLFGKATFDEFYRGFLTRDIQKELAIRALNPVNLVRLASPYFSRIDLAAELYDETVFKKQAFAALAARPRPFIILHATNMANGGRFQFTQDEFDLMRSDLGPLPVARGVAAASAFPFLLSPLTLQSFPVPENFTVPADVRNGLEHRELNWARYTWARHRLDLINAPMPGELAAPGKWVHLLDGGLSDNLGLRSLLDAYDRGFIRQRINAGHIKRLVVIAVNARTDPPERLSAEERAPGLGPVLMKTTTVSMESVSFDTLDYAVNRQNEREQAQTNVRVCNEKLVACRAEPLPAMARDIRTCFVEIDFDALPSPEREWFLGLPTTFALPEESVKRLVDVAGRLLNGSGDFQKLLRALRSEPALGAGVGERGNCS